MGGRGSVSTSGQGSHSGSPVSQSMAVDAVQSDADKWKSSLTSEEDFAIRSYTGIGYFNVNNALRGVLGNINSPVALTGGMTVGAIARDMDSALAKSTVRLPFTTYRGVDNRFTQLQNLLKAGDGAIGSVLTDKGFVSTTLDRETRTDNNIMRIRVPAGAKGAYVESITSSSGEQEFILPRNSRFRVTGVTRPQLTGGSYQTTFDVDLIK